MNWVAKYNVCWNKRDVLNTNDCTELQIKKYNEFFFILKDIFELVHDVL